MQHGSSFENPMLGFAEARFMSDEQTPFRQASAMDVGVEIFQIEELVECADHGTAKRGGLFLELLDAQRFQRPIGWGTLHGLWNRVTGHRSYRQNKKHEPPDVEPELFTHAETA